MIYMGKESQISGYMYMYSLYFAMQQKLYSNKINFKKYSNMKVGEKLGVKTRGHQQTRCQLCGQWCVGFYWISEAKRYTRG